MLSGIAKQHGKALSFNNVLDLDSARRLLDEFDEPACVIVKHNNPCGVAIAETAGEAYEQAFACDPLSAFGGVIVLQPAGRRGARRAPARAVHRGAARARLRAGALEVLTRKEAVRILELEPGESLDYAPRERDVKRVRGGLLVQDPDRIAERRESMTRRRRRREPTEEQWGDLLFAWKVCRHVRSNAIVFAKDGATSGSAPGR